VLGAYLFALMPAIWLCFLCTFSVSCLGIVYCACWFCLHWHDTLMPSGALTHAFLIICLSFLLFSSTPTALCTIRYVYSTTCSPHTLRALLFDGLLRVLYYMILRWTAALGTLCWVEACHIAGAAVGWNAGSSRICANGIIAPAQGLSA